MRKSLVNTVACLVGVVLFVSCRHMPLYDPTSGVWLSLDIVLETNAGDKNGSSGAGVSKALPLVVPDNVRVMAYSVDTGAKVMEDYLPVSGGFIDLPVGTYDFVVYGLGTETVRVSGTDVISHIEASTSELGAQIGIRTKDGTPKSEEVNINFPIRYEPDHLFVGKLAGVYIPARAGVSETVHIKMDFASIVETWTFVAEKVTGVENISTINCYITGQVPSRYIWDMRTPSDACAIPFSAAPGKSEGTLVGEFNTFGRHPLYKSSVFLNITIQNDSGSLYQWIFNVTEQFEDPLNTDHVIRVDRPIIIPMGDEGGFSPSLNEWDADIIWVPL